MGALGTNGLVTHRSACLKNLIPQAQMHEYQTTGKKREKTGFKMY